ncbi:MAG: tRNA(Ile)-lysidine synthase [Sphingobacteriales bacterium]|jgi:tRNA(Ile)-lysidine synthase
MKDKLGKYINEFELFNPNDKVLLCISGGIDSMLMGHLFNEMGYSFGIAHCNFGLREDESDGDELFVKKFAHKLEVPFHLKKFDPLEIQTTKGMSVQMAARDLRYKWWESLRKKYDYNVIATAHHKNDLIESVLINFIRGTGIAGLHGIRPKRGNIIRPLLFATKEEIKEHVKENNIHFRHDSSNLSSKYVRNKLRNDVIPILKEINENLETSFTKNLHRIDEIENFVQHHIKLYQEKLLIDQGREQWIKIEMLKELDYKEFILYEILKKYGFAADTVNDIFSALDSQPGKIFYSEEFQLVKDRDFLIIAPLMPDTEHSMFITLKDSNYHFDNYDLVTSIVPNREQMISKDNNVAMLDFDQLKFPLQMRNWRAGDVFQPLGMKGNKKLSDFLIDEKIPLNRKSDIRVIESAGEVVWIMGYRIDNRFKITDSTNKIFRMQLIESD